MLINATVFYMLISFILTECLIFFPYHLAEVLYSSIIFPRSVNISITTTFNFVSGELLIFLSLGFVFVLPSISVFCLTSSVSMY